MYSYSVILDLYVSVVDHMNYDISYLTWIWLLVHKSEVDLILLDIFMPELDGLEAAPKRLKAKPEVKIIILSMHLS